MAMTLSEIFHPLLAEWFLHRYESPTEAQSRAWPVIAAGKHLLLSAPTGTGKTYSAFLYAINQLLTGVWEPETVRVLYISPLKALNTDIRVNLLMPLSELSAAFRAEGLSVPEIRVQTRSGDTPESERRRMLRHPPEVLITTPESLNLLLSSPKARLIFRGLKTVILDEIHSLLASKRGTHLITAVERLVPLSGEFQRIGLSATVKPMESAASFLGGYVGRVAGGAWDYEPRPVEIVEAVHSKSLELVVRYPAAARGALEAPPAAGGSNRGGKPATKGKQSGEGESFWQLLAEELRPIISRRRSTLIFVNSRRLAERLTHEINEGEPTILAYPHHGSLSRELRSVVETRMKEGELKAIVATSSLELGIDIGDLDEVLLIESPMSVAGAVQRIGRSGHAIGRTSVGTLFGSHGMDLVNAAVVSKMVVDQDIEETHAVRAPLDVLAQIIVSMTSISPWKLDDLYGFLCCSQPYHTLTRRQFDLVVDMLEGRYSETRVRELKARVSVDRIDKSIVARDGVRYLLYAGGGTIPDRGYYGLHLRGSGAKIGDLDEEFVWERRVGDAFVLGSQRWKIVGIDNQKVSVIPWKGGVNSSPFWKAERQLRSFHFSAKIGETLEQWETALSAGSPTLPLTTTLDSVAAEELRHFLRRQREAAGCPLPHRHHLLAEHTGGRTAARYLLLHTLWGGQVNQPLSIALSALLAKEGAVLDVGADNDTVVITLPDEVATDDPAGAGEFETLRAETLLRRLAEENLEQLIQNRLEASGFFGARFRENAGRALLLPRQRAGKRIPLWVTRMRAKRLLERVQGYEDFPIVAETWRECIRDDFDLPSLKQLLGEVRAGVIRLSEIATPAPSPFASGIVWLQTNQYLYADDAPNARMSDGRGGSLTSELLREMVFRPELRIQVPVELAGRYGAKLRRTEPGYAPRNGRELLDWLKERALVPLEEWRELLEAMERDEVPEVGQIEESCWHRMVGLTPPGGDHFIAPLENLARLERLFSNRAEAADLGAFFSEWLAFYEPVAVEGLSTRFGVDRSPESVTEIAFMAAIELLCEEEQIVRGALLEGSKEVAVCDAVNLERLLSYLRRERAIEVEPRPLEELTPFLARWQEIQTGKAGEGRLPSVLERLFGYPAKAELWESDLLPARLSGYREYWLDRLLRDSELEWAGSGREKIHFRFRSDTELFAHPTSTKADELDTAARLFAEPTARYEYWDLQKSSALPASEFTKELWVEVWKGHLSSDSFEPVRRGAANGFRTEEPRRHTGRRGSFGRWQSQTPLSGSWRLTATLLTAVLEEQQNHPEANDLIDELEVTKDRVRVLLDRYGVLFRELLERELPPLRWGRLFRTLRLMELSGEIAAGRFFDGIPGLQFASTAALQRLAEFEAGERLYWMNAVDPASPCGLRLPGDRSWPSRVASTHLVFLGPRLVLVSKRQCTELSIELDAGDPDLRRAFSFFDDLLARDYEPLKSIKVERINGKAVRESPYRNALIEFGFDEDFKAYSYRGRSMR